MSMSVAIPVAVMLSYGIGKDTDTYYLYLATVFFPCLVCGASIQSVHYTRLVARSFDDSKVFYPFISHAIILFVLSFVFFSVFIFFFYKTNLYILLYLFMAVYISNILTIYLTAKSLLFRLDLLELGSSLLFLLVLIVMENTAANLLWAVVVRYSLPLCIGFFQIGRFWEVKALDNFQNIKIGLYNLLTAIVYKNTSVLDRNLLSIFPEGTVTMYALVETGLTFTVRFINRIFYHRSMNNFLVTFRNEVILYSDLMKSVLAPTLIAVSVFIVTSLIFYFYMEHFESEYFDWIDLYQFIYLYVMGCSGIFFTINIQLVNNLLFRASRQKQAASIGISVFSLILCYKVLVSQNILSIISANIASAALVFGSLLFYYHLRIKKNG